MGMAMTWPRSIERLKSLMSRWEDHPDSAKVEVPLGDLRLLFELSRDHAHTSPVALEAE